MILGGAVMREFYEIKVAGLTRKLPLCPIGEDLYIGAFVLFGDVELTVACARELLKKAPEYDVMITAESKGIPLVYEMARQAGVNKYLLARKMAKLYMKGVFSVELQSITTEKRQKLFIDKEDADYMRGKRVLIVDDVISTGESVKAVEKLVQESGGIVAGRMAILAEGDANKREDIIYLEHLPLFNGKGEII
jgi:adenine phosphoribosyltransferase